MVRRSLAASIGSLVGIAGVAFSITLLSQSMRAVEAVGGTCGSGGPYQIRQPCPHGVGATFPLAIVGGLVFLGLFAACAGERGRRAAMLAWSALFLTLAWNFFDYGLKGGSAGGSGFLVSGVVFVILGVVPLVWVIPSMVRGFVGTDEESSAPTATWLTRTPSTNPSTAATTPPWSTTPSWPGGATTFSTATPTVTTSPPVSPASGVRSPGDDLATELERLASLHRRGELTDAEYDAAKQRAIQHGGTS